MYWVRCNRIRADVVISHFLLVTTYQIKRSTNSPNAGNTKSSLPIAHRRLNTKTAGILFIAVYYKFNNLQTVIS